MPTSRRQFFKSPVALGGLIGLSLVAKGCAPTDDGIEFTMREAFHSAGAQLTGFEGTNRIVGETVGYIIEFENDLKLYHPGDTSLMGDMKTIIGDYYQPKVDIPPIDGIFTMGPEKAACARQLIRPKIVIPEHYGTFPALGPSCCKFKDKVLAYLPDIDLFDAQPGVPVRI